MPIDASIYEQIQQPQQANPLAALAQAYQIKGLQAGLDKEQRAADTQNRLLQLVQDPSFASLPVNEKAARLQSVGAFDQAGKLVTSEAAANKDTREAQGSQLKNAGTTIDMIGQVLGTVNDQASYERGIKTLNSLGVPTPNAPAQYDPAVVQQFAQQAVSAKDRMTNATTQQGQAITMRGQDMAQGTAIRGQDLSRDTALQGQGVTMRGQDMADTRQRDANLNGRIPSGYRAAADGTLEFIPGGPADPNTKPAGGKPLNDTQAKALQFGSRMQNANEIIDKLADEGVNTSIPGSRSGYGVGAVINAMQPESRQQLDQAKRDFINAVLRRESGAAISPSEFDSAEKQYFPQPGEGEGQRAQKKAARELSMRGILAEVPDADNRVAQVRGPQASKPAAVVTIKNAADYAALPSGATYIDPTGKQRTKK